MRWGRIGIATWLLAAGADPHAADNWGKTPIDLARHRDDDATLLLLSRQHEPPLPPPCGKLCSDDILALLVAPPLPPPCGNLCETKFWNSANREWIRSVLAQAPAAERWSAPGGGPLHLALAASAGAEIAKILLEHGADPNGRNARDDTPLHVAARTPGSAEAVALLLAHGAIPNAANAEDWTPLHAASERMATLDAMRLLLDAGANPHIRDGYVFGVTPLHLAVSQPEGARAAMLMLNYVDINVSELLLAAARGGHPDTVELLLDRGARVEYPNAFGHTAIHSAAAAGNTGTMRVLLRHGASPNHSKYELGFPFISGEGLKPIHWAISGKHLAAVELLLELGADPNGRVYATGETPLHYAVNSMGTKCLSTTIGLLLTHGADPNAQDEQGDTPLHGAVYAGCGKGIFADLLRHGADPSIPGYRGVTPLDLAKRELEKRHGPGYQAIIRLLEEAG